MNQVDSLRGKRLAALANGLFPPIDEALHLLGGKLLQLNGAELRCEVTLDNVLVMLARGRSKRIPLDLF